MDNGTSEMGWQKENGGWRFYLKDGSENYVVNDWYKDGDLWYWFDGNGIMVHNVWYQYKGHWYYLGRDGAMVKGLQTISGKWYYLDEGRPDGNGTGVLTPQKDGALQYPKLTE